APQTVLVAAMQNMNYRMFGGQLFGQLAGPIRRIIVNDQHVNLDRQRQQPLHKRKKILTLVIRRHYDEGLVHANAAGTSICNTSPENKPPSVRIFTFAICAALLSLGPMLAFLISNLLNVQYWLRSPWLAVMSLFQLWMLIDAIRRREWVWALFIVIGWGFSALFYYFAVYRAAPSATRGFELPGAHDRRRIKELQAKIHHLDKAHHHSQLGDIYFQQGKLDKAEACYRAAMERDPVDIDTRAHLGQCLLRQKRTAEARPLLEGVVAEKPEHDYGHTMMALAETLQALGETDAA